MPASVANDNAFDVSSPESQFVPQEGDEEALWKVIEITAENKKSYKVRWEGLNPDTGKPWPQSWVARHDCTDDLVAEWKYRQAKKKRGTEKKKVRSTALLASKVSSRTTTTSSPSAVRREPKVSFAIPIANRPHHDLPAASPIYSPKPLHVKTSLKRERADEISSGDPNVIERQSKKIKLATKAPSEEQSSFEVLPTKKRRHASVLDDGHKEPAKHGPQGPSGTNHKSNPRGKNSPLEDTPDKGQPSNDISGTLSSLNSANKGKKPTSNLSPVRNAPSKKLLAATKPNRRESKRKPSNHSSKSHRDTRNLVQRVEIKLPTKVRKKSQPHNGDDLVSIPNSEDDVIDLLSSPPKTSKPRSRPLSTGATSRSAFPETSDSEASRDELPPPPSAHSSDFDPTDYKIHADYMRGWNSRNDNIITQFLPSLSPHQNGHTASTSPLILGAVGSVLTPPHQPLHTQGSSSHVSIVSRMKPRTPSSSNLSPTGLPSTFTKPQNSNAIIHRKPLGPVPSVSPSTFRPYLSSSIAPSTSHIDSGTEGIRYQPSPIEHFSSPEKEEKRKESRNRHNGDYISTESNVMIRGQESADPARQKRTRMVGKEMPKKTLSEFKAKKGEKNKGKDAGQVLDLTDSLTTNGEQNVSSRTDSDLDGFVEYAEPTDLPLAATHGSALEGGDIPDAIENAEDATLAQQMEDAYVDLTGWAGLQPTEARADGQDAIPEHVRLREEEEESTQDIMVDIMRASVDKRSVGLGNHSAAVPSPDVEMDLGGVIEDHQELQMERTEDAQTAPPTAPPEDLGDDTAEPEAGLRVIGQPEEPVEGQVPPSTSENAAKLQIHRYSESNQAERENTSHVDSVVVRHTQSWQSPPLEGSLQASMIGLRIAELEQQENELRTKVEADKIAWDAERSDLLSSLETQKRGKVSAEEDRDFFKEQYEQASRYVSSVHAENKELEQRATIAEKQVTEGVRLVRETFSEREKQLAAEIKKYKDLSGLLMERDRRTGDDIRRRAGEEPGLRARCQELEKQVQQLYITNLALQIDLEEMKAEKAILESSRVNVKAEERGETDAISDEPGDDELVYQCEWKADGSSSCGSLFLDVEELRNHLFTGGHLQEG